MEQIQASPIFLGLSSQKGGVGKSTLAEIVSSILYYEKGIHLFAVDCDLSQDSFYKLREREKACIESDPQLSRQMKQYFSSLGRTAYRILKADPKDAIAKANDYIRKHPSEKFDLVIFDFPGHAGTSDLLQLSLDMDYILSPLEPDVQSMVACLTYIKAINDLGVSMSSARIKEIILLWNKVDRRVKNTLIEYYSKYIKNEDYTLLDQHIYATHRFSHELEQYGFRGVFRSTYLPPNKALRTGTGIDELTEELLTHIQLK
ncbi:ParA family protein [Segatella buccae]|uniref:ParA family protein n=1 Tax=Segatella buccae TaxID=28126 RepID=UPI000660D2D3|nr:ParA family protein [Segatella buccae]